MFQIESDKALAAEERTEEARSFVRRVRTAARRKYTAEEKTRILLEGFRREVAVNDLCQREGINPHSYYAWTKELMEVGKERLARDTLENMGFSVSESKVYRILRREGLAKRAETRLAAGTEYHRKTTGPLQMWATDASYFRVVGWGCSYLVTVMDDYSRFIMAHRLQRDMTSDSFI